MKQDNAFSLPAKLLRYLLMAFVLMISLYPILWVFLNSFKRTPGGLGLPDEWVFDGYITIFTKLNIGQYFLNSLIVTVPAIVLLLLFGAMAAWVFARGRGAGLKVTYFIAISGVMLPPAIVVSLQLLDALGLSGKQIGLILFYVGTQMSIAIFLMTGFVKNCVTPFTIMPGQRA